MAVADASFLIALERQLPGAVALQATLEENAKLLRIPAVAWLEFIRGVRPASRPSVLSAFQAGASFVAFDGSLAMRAALLQDQLTSGGKRLGLADLIIAATALSLNEPLLTMDRGFSAVPGLETLHP